MDFDLLAFVGPISYVWNLRESVQVLPMIGS